MSSICFRPCLSRQRRNLEKYQQQRSLLLGRPSSRKKISLWLFEENQLLQILVKSIHLARILITNFLLWLSVSLLTSDQTAKNVKRNIRSLSIALKTPQVRKAATVTRAQRDEKTTSPWSITSEKEMTSTNFFKVEEPDKKEEDPYKKKQGPKIKSFPGGTISFVKFNNQQETFGKMEFGNKKTIPEDAWVKLKWKTIQYLLENKKS